MILHFAGIVSTLPSNPVCALVKVEVSAILPSIAGPLLLRALYNRTHEGSRMTAPARLAICCSRRSNLFNALPSAPDSKTPFKSRDLFLC